MRRHTEPESVTASRIVSTVFPKQLMAHCLLSHKEARELERDGKTPDCRNGHRHLPAKDAKTKVLNGTHRWAGDRECRIVEIEAKEWAKAPSAGYAVLQMRRVFRQKQVHSAQHFGMQCGKQPRVSATQARDVNQG